MLLADCPVVLFLIMDYIVGCGFDQLALQINGVGSDWWIVQAGFVCVIVIGSASPCGHNYTD
jgi:hypothetical protein